MTDLRARRVGAPSAPAPGVGGEDSRALKVRAVGYLSRREYSRMELRGKLQPHAGNADDLERVLDALEREHWLSDERFARALVHRKATRQGAARIVSDLRRHGLPEERLDAVKAELMASEFDRARAVWGKKFGNRPQDAREYGRQYRFLAARGFSADSVRRVLGDLGDLESR